MSDPAAKGEDWVIDRNPSTEGAAVSGGAAGAGGGASTSRPPQQQFRGSDEVDRSNLIINYLPSDLTDEQLRVSGWVGVRHACTTDLRPSVMFN